MKLKLKMMELRRQFVSGALPRERPQLALVLSWVLNFVLGFVLAVVPVFGGCGPFGIAITAQAGAQLSGLFCALGASAGYLAAFSFDEGIKYVAAVVLVFTASYVFQELKIYTRQWFMPLVASVFSLFTGILGSLQSFEVNRVLLPIFAVPK